MTEPAVSLLQYRPMSFKHLDVESALRRLADRRIEDAMKEGKFDNLPGAGKPLDLEPMPAEENARLTWWALRILKQNDLVPHEVQFRKAIDHLKAELAVVRHERRLEQLAGQINDLVRKLNTLGTNALHSAVVGVDLETERANLRRRLASEQ